MTALTIAEATAVEHRAVAAPRLRRLPVPLAEPRAALRVVRDDDPGAPDPSSPTLPLGDTSPELYALMLEADAVTAFCAAVPTSTRALPQAAGWVRQFVQAAVEVSAGQRPATQLVRWADEGVLAILARRGRLARRQRVGARRIIVHSARTSDVRDGVVEASSVVSDGSRMRAVALRLEGLDGRWRVTAFELG